MSKNKIIFIIGILTVIMQFLGFPSSWNNIFYIIFGLVLIVIAVVSHTMRRSAISGEHREVVTEIYVESSGTDRI